MSTQTLPLNERLKNGARILGVLWKQTDQRCPRGWSLEVCDCMPPKKFCQAREQWMLLAFEAGRDLQEGPYGIIHAMTAAERDATGLALKMNHPEIGEVLAGTKPGCAITFTDWAKLSECPEMLGTILRVMKVFPKSTVEGVEMPVEVPTKVEVPASKTEANPDEAFE